MTWVGLGTEPGEPFSQENSATGRRARRPFPPGKGFPRPFPLGRLSWHISFLGIISVLQIVDMFRLGKQAHLNGQDLHPRDPGLLQKERRSLLCAVCTMYNGQTIDQMVQAFDLMLLLMTTFNSLEPFSLALEQLPFMLKHPHLP